MKIIIGPAAEDDLYFDRPALDQKFWKKMRESHNVCIAAPRRVGKSSFMLNLVKKGNKDCECIYLITESINESNEFFKKVYKILLTQLEGSDKLRHFFESIFKRLDVKKISTSTIEFGKTDVNYFDEILVLCKEVEHFPKKILLLIDEFSQTIENIITDVSKESAKVFLHQCRELRQNPAVKSKINFVYTGSIGLENLVLSIDEPRSISDLGNFTIPPLTKSEAEDLIDQIMDGEDYVFNTSTRLHFFSRLKWLLPYFIQVVISEIENVCTDEKTKIITPVIIDKAFSNSLNNRSYFEHWLSRLRSIFKGGDFSCAKEILNISAKSDGIHYYDLQNLLTKYNIEDNAVIINTLIHDGYVVEDKATKRYRFNSPLLQQWWLLNIVI